MMSNKLYGNECTHIWCTESKFSILSLESTTEFHKDQSPAMICKASVVLILTVGSASFSNFFKLVMIPGKKSFSLTLLIKKNS